MKIDEVLYTSSIIGNSARAVQRFWLDKDENAPGERSSTGEEA